MTCVPLRVKVNIEDEEEGEDLNEDRGRGDIKDEVRVGLIKEQRGSMEIDGGSESTAAQRFEVSLGSALKVKTRNHVSVYF